MDGLEDYRRQAEEAERLARKALTANERDSYERIAKGWRDLMAAETLTRHRAEMDSPRLEAPRSGPSDGDEGAARGLLP